MQCRAIQCSVIYVCTYLYTSTYIYIDTYIYIYTHINSCVDYVYYIHIYIYNTYYIVHIISYIFRFSLLEWIFAGKLLPASPTFPTPFQLLLSPAWRPRRRSVMPKVRRTQRDDAKNGASNHEKPWARDCEWDKTNFPSGKKSGIYIYIYIYIAWDINDEFTPLVNVYSMLWKIAIEIVDLPIKNGGFFSSSLCKPNFTGG